MDVKSYTTLRDTIGDPEVKSALPNIASGLKVLLSTSPNGDSEDSSGWIEIFDKGLLITMRGKTGWHEVEIGRGSADATWPAVNLLGSGPNEVSSTRREASRALARYDWRSMIAFSNDG